MFPPLKSDQRGETTNVDALLRKFLPTAMGIETERGASELATRNRRVDRSGARITPHALGSNQRMATEKQKRAARTNPKKARAAKKSSTRGPRKKTANQTSGRMSTADQNDLPKSKFAFPERRKEPLTDAKHVRNAIARFDQVEDVTDRERAAAWKRIAAAAKKFDVEIEAGSWRDLMR
jgi:hypothetical protein